ncbi:MAG: DEAD/DEAH box helicase family protein [Clostridiales bacterium]|nr:DEAD/DEAH box helicase family protein [Clostridiales bacterium]
MINTKNFNKVKFAGTFRDYQQGVLDRAQKHLRDGKIHIVAAPGSGKTVLGLELICRLKSPALVLSPSVTIRQQWGERFCEKFLPKGENIDDYVSYDLKSPSLITSVTYQSLHAAVSKQISDGENDEDEFSENVVEDYTQFDIFALLKTAGIKTICLDEAHHLKSEWQKALEKFIETVKSSVTIIALTATPPYDSTRVQWNRYISLCGEIDEEIFVPQLVIQKTLCPHQDFVFFSYPTEDELSVSESHKIKGAKTAEIIIRSGIMNDIVTNSPVFLDPEKHADTISDNLSSFYALAACINRAGLEIPRKFAAEACIETSDLRYDLFKAEDAFNFIIGDPALFSDEISEEIRSRLSASGLIEKNKVCLITTDKITKQLISSTGKLYGINEIVKAESAALGKKLRMLILTDYIKRDMMKLVGTNEEITSMGTVPIFESVRRSCPEGVKTAMLSGSMVMIPDESSDEICEVAKAMNVAYSLKKIENTYHSEIILSGSNKNKVAVITSAFQKGLINVLIGTKSLLGEGWDSPCINSLILASFVGSFMLSNQMRGRAIRTDYNDPDKVSNIWHLVTVEPTVSADNEKDRALYKEILYDDKKIYGSDYETLKKRFDCFLAPAYNFETVESGTDRLDVITPPFDKSGIERINGAMLHEAANRTKTAENWIKSLHGSKHPEVLDVAEITNPAAPKNGVGKNKFIAFLDGLLMLLLLILRIKSNAHGFFGFILTALLIVVPVILLVNLLKNVKYIKNSTDEKRNISSVSKCVARSLKEIGAVDKSETEPEITEFTEGSSKKIYCSIRAASAHDKKVFARAIAETFSAIEDPRYVVIKEGFSGKQYYTSLSCPSAIGTKKENAEKFSRDLKGYLGKFIPVYTRNEAGRTELSKCRKNSYLNSAKCTVKIKKIAR